MRTADVTDGPPGLDFTQRTDDLPRPGRRRAWSSRLARHRKVLGGLYPYERILFFLRTPCAEHKDDDAADEGQATYHRRQGNRLLRLGRRVNGA
jgi:hypothetical protein